MADSNTSTSTSRTAEEERDLETGHQAAQEAQQQEEEEEDRVIPADEEQEEAAAEAPTGYQDKEKEKDQSLRGSEYDGRAISLPAGEAAEHGAAGGAPVGGAAGHCGVFDEEEDEDPLVALTREQCLAVLRKVEKKRGCLLRSIEAHTRPSLTPPCHHTHHAHRHFTSSCPSLSSPPSSPASTAGSS